MELHRVAVEGVDVEQVEALGKVIVSEAGTKDAARGQQRPEAAVAWVVSIAQVIAQDTAGLTALVVAAEAGSRGYAYDAVEGDAGLHQHIGDAC